MKKTLIFAGRCQKELLRDPLTYVFGVGLPLVLMVIMVLIGKNIPNSPFKVETFGPGMAFFGLGFISLFAGMIVGRDRSTSFLTRLFASPMTAAEFIGGYSLPFLLMALIQCAVLFCGMAALGLELSVNILWAMAALMPTALMYIGMGLLMGSVLSDRQVGGISSLVVNVATLLSGTWFPLELLGDEMKAACNALPFAHGLEAARLALAGDSGAWLQCGIVLLWAAVFIAGAGALFAKGMKKGK